MKVKWNLVPGQILDAKLVNRPSMINRGTTDIVLELEANGVAIQLEPPTPMGCELLEASPEELQALKDAGFNIPQG